MSSADPRPPGSGLLNPPWRGCFPEDQAQRLAKDFKFRPDFDLADRLAEAIWRFQKRTQTTISDDGKFERGLSKDQAVSQAREELESPSRSGILSSLKLMLEVGLWELNNPQKARGRSPQGKVIAAAHDALKRKQSGSAIDLPTTALYRTIGAIYKEGTGRAPTVGGTSGRFRGQGFRFAKQICDYLGIPAGQKLKEEIWVHTQGDIKKKEGYKQKQAKIIR